MWTFLLYILVVAAVTGCGGSRNGGSGLNLPLNRLLSELQEVKSLGLTLDKPFNTSKAECGIRLSPLHGNLHEWHFSLLGPEDTAYSGGCYHGRIVLPADYPQRAPSLCMLTPTGRWAVGKDICLSGKLLF
jgi:ubiquitin-protein ligase